MISQYTKNEPLQNGKENIKMETSGETDGKEHQA